MSSCCIECWSTNSHQTGLTGSTSVDMRTMFSGDNVAVHMSKLFDGRSQTRSISGDEQVWRGEEGGGRELAPGSFSLGGSGQLS